MSLQEILMQRAALHFNNELGPTSGGTPSTLFQDIANSLKESKDRKLAEENEKARFQEAFGSGETASTGGKLDGIIKTATYEPGKGTTIKYSLENDSQRATRIKTQMEVRQGQEQESIVKQFNAPGSTLTITDLTNAGIKPTDAAALEEQRVPILQAREALMGQYKEMVTNQASSFVSSTPIQSGVRTTGNIVIPKYGPSGRSEGSVDINAQNQIDTAAADVAVAKEVRAQQAKAGELAERGVQRASGTTNTAMDEVFRFNQENMKKYDIKPGQAFGWLEKLQPDQTNRYKAAAVGAGREAAATVGTQIIPAARAVRMVDIFAKSTAEVGNTVEGNAANVAASMGNVWGTALSSNFDVEMNDGSKVPIKSVVKDPLTGKFLSEIPYPDNLMAIGRATEEFKLKTEQYYLNKAFDQYPDILQDSTKQTIAEQRRLDRIQELRSKL